MKSKLSAALVVIGLASGPLPAQADVFKTFDVQWSGSAFGNSAQAEATITIDVTLLPDPTAFYFGFPITALSLTVTGAGNGDGTFGLNDYALIVWSTDGASLNLNQQLVGQATPDGPWGSCPGSGTCGDFNLLALNNSAPSGLDAFQLETSTITLVPGRGLLMNLTSFAPVPGPIVGAGLPGLLMAGAGLVGLWHRKRNALVA
jgi:hypothetical protein